MNPVKRYEPVCNYDMAEASMQIEEDGGYVLYSDYVIAALTNHTLLAELSSTKMLLEAANTSLADMQKTISSVCESVETAFVDRLLHAINMQGIDVSGWDGDCDPAQIIANGISTLIQEARSVPK